MLVTSLIWMLIALQNKRTNLDSQFRPSDEEESIEWENVT